MKALVIGLGISGKGAAKLLLQKGYEVIAVDRCLQEMDGVQVLPETAEVGEVDLTILSPGIPQTHPQALGKEPIGEVELAMRFLKNRAIGITGTNGKTTLTLLLTHILNHAGMKARAIGNVGNSLAEYACAPDPDEFLVVELSSYQLETMTTQGFEYGIITNISPDHLDRYPSFEKYKQTKERLRELVTKEMVSYLQLTEKGRYSEIEQLAWILCQKLGVDQEVFEKALKTFKAPPHRIEVVKEIDGVLFINDSKATNSAAVLYGLKQVQGPVFIIAGGKGKGESFESLKKPFQEKVKKVFAIGQIAHQLEKELENVEVCKDLEEAVRKAKKEAQRGDTVLLSPGAASFDQFQSYVERGEKFKEYVQKLAQGN